ncbi:ABC transporter permease [Leptolyngbya sp. FACHB-261]|uniref:ABC transporter permease n=1 Tax=Leptolyngbya sp. FACHB-261 TaxID=2692806 RepID=UPI0016876D87|nr:iron export ABC transporter permease subunit FetB [Leptolyngbya sp. FACHB-261]MBD2100829.1 iron export ABC transporter permease subunit FetB [Leptolyngbya sp. FACHB-261]
MEAINPSWTDLSRSLALIGVVIGLSIWQQLGVTRDLLVATLRTVIQLVLVGFILKSVFAIDNPWAELGILLLMGSIAALEARNRLKQPVAQALPILTGSIFLASGLTLVYVTQVVIQPVIWYDPHYVIPLAGMILGNAMNAAALAAERLQATIRSQRSEIEARLVLGASPSQVCAPYIRTALKTGLIPTINSMMVVGLVSLPGTMTGQILAGADPAVAVKYQLVIIIMLAFTNATTALLVALLLAKRFFNSAWQLQCTEQI